MLTHTTAASRRRSARTAGIALAVLLLAACGPFKGGANDEGAKGSKASQAPEKPLRLGEPSTEPQEIGRYDTTGKFTITPQRVVTGKASDLDELKDEKYKGWLPVWVYVNAKLIGGDSPVRGPMIMSNVGVRTADDVPVTRLLTMMRDLSSKPADCKDDIEAEWKTGDEHTHCALYLVPEGKPAAFVTYSQGYYKEPLKWTVN
ncbi:hypothetical protein MTF65_29415 [Streptomyces sp. APSN-46.1]|uniref:hypothetical protein n=1 Tax=Streptomyces sp. APSN-46.1 TaxID=2929049 RepID=UPI001FB4A5B6|nr:hypothetical protein [Streptomyces sp. APSN-46.1]MCJ1681402.1 hypothetical protein [Streptomyces sp. APSN-46.1]